MVSYFLLVMTMELILCTQYQSAGTKLLKRTRVAQKILNVKLSSASRRPHLFEYAEESFSSSIPLRPGMIRWNPRAIKQTAFLTLSPLLCRKKIGHPNFAHESNHFSPLGPSPATFPSPSSHFLVPKQGKTDPKTSVASSMRCCSPLHCPKPFSWRLGSKLGSTKSAELEFSFAST